MNMKEILIDTCSEMLNRVNCHIMHSKNYDKKYVYYFDPNELELEKYCIDYEDGSIRGMYSDFDTFYNDLLKDIATAYYNDIDKNSGKNKANTFDHYWQILRFKYFKAYK